MAVQAQPDDYKMWVPIQKSEVFSDGIQESVESDERPDKDSGEDKDDPPEGEANKDGPSEEDEDGPPEAHLRHTFEVKYN